MLLRYNVNNYIGLGAGFQNTISVSEKRTENRLIEQFDGDVITQASSPFKTFKESESTSKSYSNLRTGLLFEATAGFARIGPSLGARYILNFEENFNYWQFYAIWKF